jgi:EmrB/QacA subfamily drug resistance transporter
MEEAMRDTVAVELVDTRRWWVLAVVVAAQFMFVVDAFIVNVAIPSIRVDLQAGTGEVQGVIAIYQIAYASLVITGGRLGDIHGRKRIFLIGLLGFTATSIWCGCARSAEELVMARLVQGATAALMSPQVLATIHTLFPDAARAKAFALFGIALGLGGGLGFVLGGWLVTMNLAGLGWRTIFFVNGPVGAAIAVAAWRLMPHGGTRRDLRLDGAGALLLFLSLVALIVPLLIGQDAGWPWWLLPLAAAGAGLMSCFVRLERRLERRGGMPLIDLALLADPVFQRGLAAACCLFGGNISFYLAITLFLQNGLAAPPLQAGLTMLPLTLAFVVASRHGARHVAQRGIVALIAGCGVQLLGLAATAVVVALQPIPPLALLAVPLTVFGYGQGLVMAPLFGTILAGVRHAHAGAGSGILATTQQIANGAGVALIGAVYTAVMSADGDRAAMLVALLLLAGTVCTTAWFLALMRRAAERGEMSG